MQLKQRPAKILFLFLFLFQAKPVFSQVDSILMLPPEKQLLSLLKRYQPEQLKNDPLPIMTELVLAEKLFAEKGNTLLQREAWLLWHHYQALRSASPAEAAAIMLKDADTAAERSWKLTQAECWHIAGNFYFRDGMYVPAFEYLQKAQNVFDQYDKEKYPHIQRYADAMANCYYHFGEYREAIRYLKKIEQLPPGWDAIIYIPSVNNTIALCYQQLKQYDSAAIWYKEAHDVAAVLNDSFYMALANGNLGYTYYLQEQYDRALPLLQADYRASVKARELGSATNAAITLSAIYIKKGQLNEAQQYIDLSREFVYNLQNTTLFKNWYADLYYLAKASGDLKNVGTYADSLLLFTDSAAAMRDKKAFNQAVLKIETEKHLNEVNQLESRRRHQIMLRNSLLAGLVLITIIAVLWVNRQLLKRNKEKEIVQQQLQFATDNLLNYTQQLKEKNELLECLRQEINSENVSNERVGHLNTLLTATILTEEDWKKFRLLFEKVYPGFFIRLKEKMPDLSATDTRLLALTKLQLPPKDMASMLGVSYEAVKKARQRLRKKINLPEEGGLEDLAEMI